MSKGSKEALTVLIVTHVTHVERVKRLHNVHNIDTFNAMSKGSKNYVMLKQGIYTFLLITFLIFVTVLREPWPLCTGIPGVPVVKAHWALVTALQKLWYGRYGPVKQSPEANCQQLLPGTWRHTEFPVDGVHVNTSLCMSCTGNIKAAATPSWGVQRGIQSPVWNPKSSGSQRTEYWAATQAPVTLFPGPIPGTSAVLQ